MVQGLENETCIDSSVSSNWIVFNGYWIVFILLESKAMQTVNIYPLTRNV